MQQEVRRSKEELPASTKVLSAVPLFLLQKMIDKKGL